jgi:RNA polymerase sigma-70 factor (ECF subfamily)
MGYLRQARSALPQPAAGTTCIAVYERELDYVLQTLRRLGASPWEMEDLAQEVFLVLHRNWDTLDTSRPLRAYLFGTAFRVVCAQRRRRIREIPFPELDAEDTALSPEMSVHAQESVRVLLAALERIPLQRRAVIIMHDLDGFSVAEIAHRLSITRFNTYARLRKARKELAVAARRLLRGGGF